MGSLADDMEKSKSHIKITELHPYFGAEISGVNLSTPMSDDVFENIVALSAKYGVIVFRSTGLDDTNHVELARRFGPLFSMKKVLGNTKTRLKTDELADLSNIDPDTGEPVPAEGPKAQIGRLASFFHPDLAYSQQRASWSLLRAHEIPPPGYGGDTIFADTRTAFDQLDDVESGLKKRLLSKNYCGVHSWQHAQKISNPDLFKDLDPSAYPMARHQLVELHQPSKRMNLYVGLYMHHIECAPKEDEEMADLQHKLLKHATQAKYQLHVEWHHPGDLVIWDNR
ncbi:Alpha-ketoglutarate-dependent 2,4-dichlorophenoxyacetate dioxygenase [Colletotrichum fructicola]|nr:Alpha-ketoglutarate-dependent 2,4-dichlorophenoxyacetate dioxygenase [Colletotrichum fructicola]KAF4941373.1 Alpha-ketoglutarate-dependent 2,4-dichlorophenoxyacetate dioxygenase [Colletotrichum fructicola]